MVKQKSYKVVWDRLALNHFKEILSFLAKQSDSAPKIVKSAILSRLDLIRSNALICEIDKLKEKSNEDFRAFIVFSYRVTYQIKHQSREINILRVRHTSREPLGY